METPKTTKKVFSKTGLIARAVPELLSWWWFGSWTFVFWQISLITIRKGAKWALKWTIVRFWMVFFHVIGTCLRLEGHIGKITSITQFAMNEIRFGFARREDHSPSKLDPTEIQLSTTLSKLHRSPIKAAPPRSSWCHRDASMTGRASWWRRGRIQN